MKRIWKQAVSLVLAAVMVLGLGLWSAPAKAEAPRVVYGKKISAKTYESRAAKFIKDKRWKSGISWGARRPKLSKANGSGCYAYTCDFVAYVYGKKKPSDGKKFTSASSIRTGDIVKVTPDHWFVVLKRTGNKLKVAEGNRSKKVKVSTSDYTIKNGVLYRGGKKYKKFSFGYHFM